MKYNIAIEVYHPTHGHLGNGVLLFTAEKSHEAAQQLLDAVHIHGFRENGFTFWDDKKLIAIGKRVAEECTVKMRIIEDFQ